MAQKGMVINMISKKNSREIDVRTGAEGGNGSISMDKLNSPVIKPSKVRKFAHAKLEPGASVGYHVHYGESETFYFLSGKGKYSDNGTEIEVNAGDVTYTPDGEGHSIENIGDDVLEFLLLIVVD